MSGFKTIRHDSSTEGAGGTGTTATWSHTIGANNQRLLVVCVGIAQSSGTISSATFNGVEMTKAINKVLVAGSNYESAIFYLVNPPTGSYNVVVTFSTSSSWAGGSSSWFGVKQTSPLDNTGEQALGVGTPSINTTVVENAVLIDNLLTAAFVERTQDASQTLIYSDTISTGDSGGGSYKLATTAGSYNMTWTSSPGDGFAYVTASFKPAILDGGSFIFNII